MPQLSFSDQQSSQFISSRSDTKVFIIEDDPIMTSHLARICSRAVSNLQVQTFRDVFMAVAALNDSLPDLILLDILLNGPDGYTFLNEIMSYSDTARIPIIIVSSLYLQTPSLAHYGIRQILHKDTMTPADILEAIQSEIYLKSLKAEYAA